MVGPEYAWLLAPMTATRGAAVRLARGGLATLALGAVCAAFLLGPGVASLTVAGPALAAPAATVALKDTAQAEWPHALVRLWILVPQLIPTDR